MAAAAALTQSGDDRDPVLERSSYADRPQFERTIQFVTVRLAKGRWFHLERGLLVALAIWLGVETARGVMTVAGFAVPAGPLSGRVVLMLWLLWLLWLGSMFGRLQAVRRRVLEDRLCFCCGQSLCDVVLDEHDRGECPKCGMRFELGEYIEPANCVVALRSARERMLERCPAAPPEPPGPRPALPAHPFFLYRNLAHYRSVMRATAGRIENATHGAMGTRLLVFLGAILVACVWAYVALGPIAVAFWIVLAPAGGVIVLLELMRRERTLKRIIDERLCLGCGYSLVAMLLDDRDGGTCPECGRPFNLREYQCPHDSWSIASDAPLRALCIPMVNESD